MTITSSIRHLFIDNDASMISTSHVNFVARSSVSHFHPSPFDCYGGGRVRLRLWGHHNLFF
jgi:hypothetical protein